jgi:hypothetical protein
LVPTSDLPQTEHAEVEATTRRCPQCKQALVFEARYPVFSTALTVNRDGSGPQYQPAWVCRNPNCDYRELVD